MPDFKKVLIFTILSFNIAINLSSLSFFYAKMKPNLGLN